MTNGRARARLLAALVAVAAAPRVWAAIYDQGIFWPDEIMQTLEPAHRLAFGYGLVAWEFQDGARSWVFPGFLAGVWKSAAIVGLHSAPALIVSIKLMMVVVSLCGVVAAALLAESLAGPLALPLAGALAASFPASLVYAHRAMAETASGTLIVVACLLLQQSGSKRDWLAGLLSATAIFVRYQNGLVAAGLLVILLARRRRFDAFHYAVALGLFGALGGMLDWLSWGQPFHSFLTYVQYNFIEGKSSMYGVASFGYYLSTAWSSTGWPLLLVLLGFVFGIARAPGLSLLALVYVLAHHLVPHKELRFLMPIVPLFLALAGAGLANLVERWWQLQVTERTKVTKRSGKTKSAVVSSRAGVDQTSGWGSAVAWTAALGLALAMLVKAPALTFGDMGQYLGSPLQGRSPWHWMEDFNRLFWKTSEQQDLCGLGLLDLAPVWTGGYSYLHRDVALLPIPSNAPASDTGKLLAQVNYLIAPAAAPPPSSYAPVATIRDVTLLHRSGSCAASPQNYRLLPKE